jgi:uncharacterized Tic20 family protein
MTAPPDLSRPSPAPAAALTPEEKTWGTMAHVSSGVGAVVMIGFGVFGPLAIWTTKGKRSAYVAGQCKEALNFQITMLIVSAVCFASGFVCGIVGFMTLGVAVAVNVVMSIVAAVASRNGKAYRYPVSVRFVG